MNEYFVSFVCVSPGETIPGQTTATHSRALTREDIENLRLNMQDDMRESTNSPTLELIIINIIRLPI